jgi:hypothetical protein
VLTPVLAHLLSTGDTYYQHLSQPECSRRQRRRLVTVIADHTPVLEGHGPARLLDMVPGRSAPAIAGWLAAHDQGFRDRVEIARAGPAWSRAWWPCLLAGVVAGLFWHMNGSRGLGVLAVVAAGAAAVNGIALALSGFSGPAMPATTVNGVLASVWMLLAAVWSWRRAIIWLPRRSSRLPHAAPGGTW